MNFTLKAGVKVDTSTVQQQLNKSGFKPTIKVQTQLDDGKIRTTTKYVNGMKQSFTEVDGVIKTVSSDMQVASTRVGQLGQNFLDTTGKVLKFGASTAIIGLFTVSISEGIKTVKEMDASLIELRKVTDLSGDGLKNFTQDAFEMGKDLSTTASNVTDAVTEFSKSGYDIGESEALANSAIVFQTIADDAISASDSANMLIQVMKAYNLTANESMHITDAINEVSNRYAVSSSDLSGAIGKVASTANTAGVDFEHLLGIITASTEITKNASKTANGLKSVFVNLMSDKYEEQFRQFGLSMRYANGEMKNGYDLLSELAPIYKTLMSNQADVNETTVAMRDNMKKLLTDIGGKYNYNVLTASLQNFNQAVNATNSALNSSGSAMEEYNTSLDSIEKKTDGLKGAFQELIYGQGGVNSFIKNLLDAGTAILNFIDSDLGRLTLTLTATIALVYGLSKAFISFKSSSIIDGIQRIITSITALKVGIVSTTDVLKTLGATMMDNPLFYGTVIVASVVAIAKAIDYFVVTVDESIEKLEDLKKSYDETSSKTESLRQRLKEITEQINNIESGKVKFVDEEQLRILKQQEDSLKSQVFLANQKLAIQRQELELQAKDILNKTYGVTIEKGDKTVAGDRVQDLGEGDYVTGTSSQDLLNKAEQYKQVTNAIRELEEANSRLLDSEGNLKNNTAENSQIVRDNQLQIELLKEKQNNLSSSANKLATSILTATDSLDGLNSTGSATDEKEQALIDTGKEAVETWENVSDAQKDTENQAQDLQDRYGSLADSVQDYMNTNDVSEEEAVNAILEEQQKQVEDLASAYDDAVSKVGDLGSSYETLSSAVDEYNSTGSLSFETISKLLSLGDEYLSLLSVEDGQMSINADGYYALANATIDEAEAKAYSQYMSELNAGAMYDEADAKNTSASASSTVISSNNAQISSVSALVQALNVGTDAYWALWNAETKGAIQSGNVTAERARQIGASLKSNLTVLESARANIGKATTAVGRNTGATRNNTGARKSNTDATKAQTDALKAQKKVLEQQADALEKEIDKMEIVIEYQKDLLQESIDAIEEEKDATLSAIKEKMDALDDWLDKTLEDYDKQIDALEEQKDAESEYYDEQIKAINSQNQALEENIKLQQLQEAVSMAKTQKVKVLRDGKFVYETDNEALSKAEEDLANYERELAVEKQIAELEKLKESALNTIDKQIEAIKQFEKDAQDSYDKQYQDLQNLYNKKEAMYDAQLAQLKAYQKAFDDMLDAHDRAYAKKLSEEYGLEKKNWDDRLRALAGFVSGYDSKRSQLDGIKNQIQSITNQISNLESQSRSAYNGAQNYANMARGAVNSANSYMAQAQKAIYGWKVTGITPSGSTVVSGGSQTDYDEAMRTYMQFSNYLYTHNGKKQPFYHDVQLSRYASGTYGVGEDEVALVGDDPRFRELVIGSKVNSGMGTMMNLKSGTGVVPAKQTNSLTKMLTEFVTKGMDLSTPTYANNSTSESTNITIQNLNLPQVKDGADFVNYIKNEFVNNANSWRFSRT